MRIIAGEARGRRIAAPPGKGTRPPLDGMRQAIFDILGGLEEDADVLDLFAGSGAFGLEAISRGARHVTFVEREGAALQVLGRNLQELGFTGRARVVRGDALRWTPDPGGYHLIFVDPPFAMFADPEETATVLARVDALVAGALRPGGALLLREPTECAADPPRPPSDRRRFGDSTVLIFAEGGAGGPP